MDLDQARSTVRSVADRRALDSETVGLVRAHGRIAGRTSAVMQQPSTTPEPSRGIPMTPLRVARLAASGRASVEVVRKPTVAVFTVGESIEPGLPLAPGQAHDGARDLLVGLLRADGLEPTAWPGLPADGRQVEIALRDAGCAFDCIIVCAAPPALPLVLDVLAGFGSIDVRGIDEGGARLGALFGVLDEACLLAVPSDPAALVGLYLTIGRDLLDGLQRRTEPRAVAFGMLTGPADPAVFQFARVEMSPTGNATVLPLPSSVAGGGDSCDANAVIIASSISSRPAGMQVVQALPLPCM